jgi:hypothetical protein
MPRKCLLMLISFSPPSVNNADTSGSSLERAGIPRERLTIYGRLGVTSAVSLPADNLSYTEPTKVKYSDVVIPWRCYPHQPHIHQYGSLILVHRCRRALRGAR